MRETNQAGHKATPPQTAESATAAQPGRSPGRWWFRIAAVVGIPLAFLTLLETTLRLSGFGYSPHFFVRRQVEGESVWIDNQDFGRRFFPPGLERSPQPLKLAARKPPGTLRVFVLGESAAMGDPDLKFGLPRMLKVLLQEQFPQCHVEVINAAVVAINSHVILPIAEDCARHEGDLWVVYMGNNEMIGPFGSASIFGARVPALTVVRAGLWLKTTRVGQMLDEAVNWVRQGSRPLPEWGGMEMIAHQRVSHQSAATAKVYRHFQRNLTDILRTGAHAGVPIVLCTVASNLKDCAPFASLHRTGLAPEELRQWQAAYDEGCARQERSDLTNAFAAYERAALIDSEYADLRFRQGECCQVLGRNLEALQYFRQARDQDALQFRADGRINGIIRQVVQGWGGSGVRVVDVEKAFSEKSAGGLTGKEYFYEHVHLTPEGNYLLARTVAEQAVKMLPASAGGRWATESECFQRLGLTDWNRYEALTTILDRIQGAPFTNQLNYAQELQDVNEQLARYRLATKPAQVRHAVGQVSQLVAQEPQDPDLRWNLAGLLERAGDQAGAEEQWRALMRIQPQSALPVFNLAKLQESTGHASEAVDLYRRCLAINPGYRPARYALSALEKSPNREGPSRDNPKSE